MAFGKIRCIGNSLHLKHKYGAGYRISVVAKRQELAPQIIEEFASRAPDVVMTRNDAGNLLFRTPRQSQALSGLLQYLEGSDIEGSPSGQLIREWGVSHTSLEDVFLEITKRHNFVYTNEDDESPDADIEGPAGSINQENTSLLRPGSVPMPLNSVSSSAEPTSYPYRALLRKNVTIQSRQKGTNCCQIFTPILVMLIMVILQFVIKSELGGSTKPILTVPTPYVLNVPPSVAFPTNFSGFSAPTTPSPAAFSSSPLPLLSGHPFAWIYGNSFTNTTNSTGSCLFFMLYSAGEAVDSRQLGSLTNGLTTEPNTGLLGK
jgi:hypothetical protein